MEARNGCVGDDDDDDDTRVNMLTVIRKMLTLPELFFKLLRHPGVMTMMMKARLIILSTFYNCYNYDNWDDDDDDDDDDNDHGDSK